MQTASTINDVGIPRSQSKSIKESRMIPPKLLRTLAFSLLAFFFTVAMGVSTSYAQTTYYVDTGGNDANNGQAATQQGANGPLQTIGEALDRADDGDTISIAAGTYAENVTVENTLTFVARTSGAQSVVRVDDLEMDGADKTLTFQANGGNTFRADNLDLTDGTIEAGSSLLAILTGGTITRTADAELNGTLAFPTNINVTYTLDAAVPSGGELPDNLGTGTLTVTTNAADDILTLTKNVTAGDFVNNGGGDGVAGGQTITVNGAVTVDNDLVGNLVANTGGAVVVNGDLTGNVTVNSTDNNSATFTFTGSTFEGNLLVDQDDDDAASGTGQVDIDGDLTGNVTVSNAGGAGTGLVDLGGSFTIDGDVDTDGAITLGNDAVVTGDVNPGGTTTLSNADATIEGMLTTSNDIAGPGEIGSVDLTSGTPDISGSPVITGMLDVQGTTEATSAADFTVGSIMINDNASFNATDDEIEVDDGSFINEGTYIGNANSGIAFTGTDEDAQFSPNPNFITGYVTVDKAGQTVTVNNNFRVESVGTALSVTNGTLNLVDYIATIGSAGAVEVAAGAEIESNTANEGGVFFVVAGATFEGEGYSNILVNTGGGNISLSDNATFSGNLTFISGSISGGAFDISPTADGQLVTVNPEDSDGVIGGASFNDAELSYNLEYNGTLTAAQTIGSELTSDVEDVTISTDGDVLILPNADVDIVNLMIETDAMLQADNTAAHTITINGALTIEEDAELESAAGFTTTFDLADDDATHTISGSVTDGGTPIAFLITGDDVTVEGSSEEDDENNFAVATFTVEGSGASVSGLQNIGAVSLDSDASLSLALIVSDEFTALNEDYGEVSGGVTIADGAELTLASAIAVSNAGLTIDDDGTLALGGNDFVLDTGLDADIEGDATVSSTGGFLVVDGATLSADGATISYLRIEGTVDEDVTVSTMLDVTDAIANTADITLEGDMDIAGDITGGTFTSTGGGTFTASADVEIEALTIEDGLTLATDDEDNARTFTVSTSYTHTSGDVELGRNTLLLDNIDLDLTNGAYTSATGTGGININSTAAREIDTGDTDLSVPNLTISGVNDVTLTDDDVLTVLGSVTFSAAGNLDSEEDEDVVLADSVTVYRTANAAGTFLEEPDFQGVINLVYDGTNTTGLEAPASVYNMTVLDGGAVTMNDDLEITGTLSLDEELDDAGEELVLSSGSSVELHDGGSLTNDINDDSNEYTVIYRDQNWAVDVDNDNVFNGSNYSVTVDDEDDNSTIIATIAAGTSPSFVNLTIGEDDQVDIEANDEDLEITGNFTVASDESIVADGQTLTFGGSTMQTIDIAAISLEIDANLMFDNEAGFTLVDNTAEGSSVIRGNLVLATGSGNEAEFEEGVLKTGAKNYIMLDHQSTSDQGFTRPEDGGHVFGNVRKTLPSAGTASNRVEFPVGGDNLNEADSTTEIEYSPVALTFDTPQNLPAGINMTVGHVEANPMGQNGFPIVDGVEEGTNIVRYPDEFYWTVKTSTPLPATEVYDIEIERQGYSEYTQTGAIADVEDIRIIRRAAGNPDNDWLLQGDNDDYQQNFQTGSFPEVYPTIIGTNIQGGIQAGAGSIFTYGLKSNLEVVDGRELTINISTTPTAFELDSLFSGGTGELSYAITTNTNPSVATATVDAGAGADTLLVEGLSEGTTTIQITATDELGDSNSGTITVNVNEAFVVATIPTQVANIGDTVTVDLSAYFTNGTAPVSYTTESSDSTVGIATIVNTSTLELTTADSAGGSTTITVTGVDATNDSVSTTFAFNVGGVFGPTGTIADITVRAGDGQDQDPTSVMIDSLRSYFMGGSDPLTYTVTSSSEGAASTEVSNDTLTVTAAAASVDPQPVTLTVTAEDATGATATQTFTVTVTPAYGDVNADGVVNSLDASSILKFLAELETFNATQEEIADVNDNGDVNSFDASVVLRYSVAEEGVTIPFSTSAKVSANGELAWGEMIREEGIVTVPLTIKGTGIYSVDFIGSFNATQASIENIEFSDLPDGWIAAKEVNDNGSVRIALAGTTPMSAGELAKVNFKLNDANEGVEFSANGYVNNRSYALDELAVKELPQSFALDQNYPNPFNPVTNVRYQLPAASDVTIELWSVTGQKVMTLVSKRVEAGAHTVQVDGARLSSGVYIYRIHAKSAEKAFTFTRKMTLIK